MCLKLVFAQENTWLSETHPASFSSSPFAVDIFVWVAESVCLVHLAEFQVPDLGQDSLSGFLDSLDDLLSDLDLIPGINFSVHLVHLLFILSDYSYVHLLSDSVDVFGIHVVHLSDFGFAFAVHMPG